MSGADNISSILEAIFFSCRKLKVVLLVALLVLLAGCFSIPQNPHYPGPPPRPPAMEEYYNRGRSFLSAKHEPLRTKGDISVERITIASDFGEILIDYFMLPQPSDSIVFVFPVLGGSNVIADYFADYLARHGIESAVVLRNDTFKKPELVDDLEILFRDNVVRDRIAIDYFEQMLGKRQFGTFGISRGALNVAVTAGVDARLKHNVMVMGATDLPSLFEGSSQRRISRYINSVMEKKQISRELMIDYLRATIMTDPKYLADFIDSRDTLLMLAMFDSTVPYAKGRSLRRQMGYPRTILMVANHFTAILYTQIVPLVPPIEGYSVFPPDYIETEALAFYKDAFDMPNFSIKLGILRVLQVPFDVIGGILNVVWRPLWSDSDEDEAPQLERPIIDSAISENLAAENATIDNPKALSDSDATQP